MLKESRAAVENELHARSTIMVQNAEEAVQQRAESSALRYCLYTTRTISICACCFACMFYIYVAAVVPRIPQQIDILCVCV